MKPKKPFYYDMTSAKSDVYDITKMHPGFESMAATIWRSRKRQMSLANSDVISDNLLANKLANCSRFTPCNSAACPRCFRYFRRWLYAEVVGLARWHDTTVGLSIHKMMTLIYYDASITNIELPDFNPQTLLMRLRKQLDRSGFIFPVVGCLDMDYHPEIKAWLPHFHLLVLDDALTIKRLRKRFFKQPKPIKGCTLTKYRPLMAKSIKDEGPGLSYLCKSYWSCREVYWDSNNKRRTHKYMLKRKELLLSLRKLDEIGFEGILFLYKVRRNQFGLRLITDI